MTSPSRSPLGPDAAGDGGQYRLPPVQCEALASLPPTAITVEYLGRTYTVPPMPASKWLEILWDPDFEPGAIFPGLAHADDDVIDALIDGQTDSTDVFKVAMEILEMASGFRWWFTVRATAVFKASWFRVGGFVTLNPADVSLGLFITSLMGQCVEHMEPRNAWDLVHSLNEVPLGFEDPLDEFSEGKAFMEAMQSL